MNLTQIVAKNMIWLLWGDRWLLDIRDKDYAEKSEVVFFSSALIVRFFHNVSLLSNFYSIFPSYHQAINCVRLNIQLNNHTNLHSIWLIEIVVCLFQPFLLYSQLFYWPFWVCGASLPELIDYGAIKHIRLRPHWKFCWLSSTWFRIKMVSGFGCLITGNSR